MKFVCRADDTVMECVDNAASGSDGSLSVEFRCPTCARGVAMVTNAGEAQMVRSLGVTIGHGALSAAPEPMSMIRGALAGQASPQPASGAPQPEWSEAALERLSAAPAFVEGMIRRVYNDYARQKGYAEITPAVMDEARNALGMTGM